MAGIPKYLGDYSTLATGGLTGNLAVTYLGSYGLDYSIGNVDWVNRVAQANFHVSNTSTIESATHPPVIDYTDFWSTHIGQPLNNFFSSGPLSKTTQDFKFSECIHF